MTHITVPDDVARLILGATGPIVLVDPQGRTVCQVDLPSDHKPLDADVAVALQRIAAAKSGGAFYSTSEVLQHIHAAGQP